jgi:hypothetical protein
VTVGDMEAALGLLAPGKAQLGLVGGRSDDPDLECRVFDCDEMVLVVPAGHD